MGKPGQPLADAGILDVRGLSILAALSITTLPELDGLLRSNDMALPAIETLLEPMTLLDLRTRVAQVAGGAIRAPDTDSELLAEEYGMGAQAPYGDFLASPAELHLEPQSTEVRSAGGCDLRHRFGPVRDQGRQRPTCVAHAIAGLRECLHDRAASTHVDLSPQFAYWNCKRSDGFPDMPGTWLRVASFLLVSDGICLEDAWNYTPHFNPTKNEGQGPPPDGVLHAAGTFRVPEAKILPPKSVESVQTALRRGCPVAVSIPAFDSWLGNPQVRLTGDIIMPLPNSQVRGGHAMLIVGCVADSDYAGGGYFIIRNSWGTRWGITSPFGAGYGTLPYNYITHYGWEAFTAELG